MDRSTLVIILVGEGSDDFVILKPRRDAILTILIILIILIVLILLIIIITGREGKIDKVDSACFPLDAASGVFVARPCRPALVFFSSGSVHMALASV